MSDLVITEVTPDVDVSTDIVPVSFEELNGHVADIGLEQPDFATVADVGPGNPSEPAVFLVSRNEFHHVERQPLCDRTVWGGQSGTDVWGRMPGTNGHGQAPSDIWGRGPNRDPWGNTA